MTSRRRPDPARCRRSRAPRSPARFPERRLSGSSAGPTFRPDVGRFPSGAEHGDMYRKILIMLAAAGLGVSVAGAGVGLIEDLIPGGGPWAARPLQGLPAPAAEADRAADAARRVDVRVL